MVENQQSERLQRNLWVQQAAWIVLQLKKRLLCDCHSWNNKVVQLASTLCCCSPDRCCCHGTWPLQLCPNTVRHAGINTAIYSPSGANSGVGFAIPVDIVRSSVDQIIRFGRVIRPILGISFAPDQSSEQVRLSTLPLHKAVSAAASSLAVSVKQPESNLCALQIIPTAGCNHH